MSAAGSIESAESAGASSVETADASAPAVRKTQRGDGATTPMHTTGSSIRLEPPAPFATDGERAGALPCSRALNSASVSARLGYFKVYGVMTISIGATVLSAKHSVHKLGMQVPGSAEALLLQRRVRRTQRA